MKSLSETKKHERRKNIAMQVGKMLLEGEIRARAKLELR